MVHENEYIDQKKSGSPLKTGSAVLLLLMLVAGLAGAQTVAKYAGEFLSIGVGGRALGLGGAYVALAEDATGGYWNPAALAALTYPEVGLMHEERFAGLINYDFGAVVIPYGPDASLGLSIIRLGIDGIPDSRDALIDQNGNGILDAGERLDYSRITYFSASDLAVYVTYAQRSSDDLFYGCNVKLIRRSLANGSATGIGFDAGVRYRLLENVFVGANAQDITTTLVAWSTGRNELISPTLKVGGAAIFEMFNGRLTPTADMDIRFENRRTAAVSNLGPISFDPHAGMEFDYKNTVAVRVGYSDIKQATLGAGLHLRKLDIDYSFMGFGGNAELGSTHRISLRLMLQEEKFKRGNSKTEE